MTISSRRAEKKKQQEQQPPAEQTQCTSTDNQNPRSFGKPLRRIELPDAEEEHEFKVDLRIERIPQVAKLEERERMTKIQKSVAKLRAGYHTPSIIADLGKTGKSTTFSEESSRTIQEMENIELCELGDISNTV